MEQTLIAQASNWLHVIFLCAMIAAAFFRLTDGRREQLAEKFGLWVFALGEFSQLAKAAHPSSTSYEVIISHAGAAIWVASQIYMVYIKVKRKGYDQ